MNVVGYAVSYKEKNVDRVIENKIQREKMQEFCAQNRLELSKIYIEHDYNPSQTRKALVELMNSAPQKKFSGVIVYTYDRLALEDDIRNWIVQELKNYGIEVFSLTEAPPLTAGQKAEKKSQTIKDKLKDLPSLPEVVTKITEIVQDPNSSAATLSKIISQDSGLTSRVLRMVNSAYYGFPKQISSIQHAITIMGFNTIKSLVLSSSIFRIFTPKSGTETVLDYKKFWKHSLLTAIASKSIYQKLFFQPDDNIFSAAILHDIGKIILDQYDHDNYANALSSAPNPLFCEAMLNAEQNFCDVTHQFIGHYVAEIWNLPDTISEVILHHHNPLESETQERLATVVYLGNTLSHLLLNFDTFSIKPFKAEILQHIGLDEDDLAQIFVDLKQEAEQLKDLESFFK
jgi:HD-like signal output (HDOD) protein